MVRSSTVVILFDIDGTLIDHDAAELIAVAALRARVEHTDDATAFLRRWRSAFERHYSRYLAGELSIQQLRRERFREVLDLNLSDAAADGLSASYIDQYLAACELYSDVKPALAQLASYPMGIISNGERSQQLHKLLKTGIDHYFDQLTLSENAASPSLRRAFSSWHAIPWAFLPPRLFMSATGVMSMQKPREVQVCMAYG
jgi:putative hydrolase of the HAD superfamily